MSSFTPESVIVPETVAKQKEVFELEISLWVGGCMLVGVGLRKLLPDLIG
jgi:hypothetical protein